MRKKISLITTSVALVATMVVAGTLAFFTDTAEVHNVTTIGSVDVTMDESLITKENGVQENDYDADRVTENTYDLMPGSYGESLIKDPIIHNEGKNDVWVRVDVKVEKTTDSNITDEALAEIKAQIAEKMKDNWTLNEADGLFYYNAKLAAGADVTVFEYDFVKDYLANKEQADLEGKEFKIDVYATAVQADNNGTTALDAAWE